MIHKYVRDLITKSITFIAIINISFFCPISRNQINSEKKENIIPITTKNNESSINTSPYNIRRKDSLIIDLKKAKKIEIISLNKRMLKGDTTEDDYQKCKTWSLTINEFKKVIREFKSMSSELQYLSYSYMLCEKKGEIKIDNILFDYWLNAGSTLTMKNNDTTLYFGCPSKKCKKYFITGELTEEELSQ